MTNTKGQIRGYLICCEGRELFVRTKEEAFWAIEDHLYEVHELVSKSEGFSDPDFEDYRSVAEELYAAMQEQIDVLKGRLEEFVEVLEAIVEVAIPTENIIENRAKLMLVNEQCKKLLAAKE